MSSSINFSNFLPLILELLEMTFTGNFSINLLKPDAKMKQVAKVNVKKKYYGKFYNYGKVY